MRKTRLAVFAPTSTSALKSFRSASCRIDWVRDASRLALDRRRVADARGRVSDSNVQPVAAAICPAKCSAFSLTAAPPSSNAAGCPAVNAMAAASTDSADTTTPARRCRSARDTVGRFPCRISRQHKGRDVTRRCACRRDCVGSVARNRLRTRTTFSPNATRDAQCLRCRL